MRPFARKHHFLPRSYLAGFAPSGRQNDFLYVLDLEMKGVSRRQPARVAFVKDFHRVDIAGVPPDIFEQLFSGFEGSVAETIARISRNLPEPQRTKV